MFIYIKTTLVSFIKYCTYLIYHFPQLTARQRAFITFQTHPFSLPYLCNSPLPLPMHCSWSSTNGALYISKYSFPFDITLSLVSHLTCLPHILFSKHKNNPIFLKRFPATIWADLLYHSSCSSYPYQPTLSFKHVVTVVIPLSSSGVHINDQSTALSNRSLSLKFSPRNSLINARPSHF